MIKTYRGLLTDGGQDKLPLHTPDGKTGYRILKLKILPESPGDVQQESIVQIWKEKQTVPTTAANIDFSDNSLVAATVGYFGAVASNNSQQQVVIFDNEIFNQDIYVTHSDNASNQSINYYLELEQIKLTENEALVAIVKDLREEQ